jgi:hypothetical protein
MTVQAGALLAGSNIGAQAAAAIAPLSPISAYSQGRTDTLNEQYKAGELDLQNRTLAANIQDKEIEHQEADRAFMHLQAQDELLNLYKERTAALEDKKFALSVKEHEDSNDIAKQNLLLQTQSTQKDMDYKDALISASKYSQDPSNPDNLLKLAQVSKTLNEEPLSPQGKVQHDLDNGLVTEDFLTKTQTAFDPATGQQVTTYRKDGIAKNSDGSPQASLTQAGVEDMQKQDNKTLADLRTQTQTQVSELFDLANLDGALKTFGYTGPVVGAVKKNFYSLLSFASDDYAKKAGAGDLIESVSSKIALLARKDMPGSMSDADRKFLVGMAPGLGKTVLGNQLLSNAAKAKIVLSKQYLTFAEQYRAQTGSLSGLSDSWDKYTDMFRVFTGSSEKDAKVVLPNERNLKIFLDNRKAIETALSKGYSIDDIKKTLGIK